MSEAKNFLEMVRENRRKVWRRLAERARYERLIRKAFLDAGGNAIPSDCYVGITVDAYFQIPKSYTKGKRLACEHNINRPDKKPDIDNILKIVLDGLNGVAYADDKQVIEVRCRKFYSVSSGYLKISVSEIKA